MSTEKRYYHRQDGKWYVLRVKPRKGDDYYVENDTTSCEGCTFFRPERERGRCAASGDSFASNTCCDCGKGMNGIWEEVGECIVEEGNFGKYRLAKNILAIMVGMEFTYEMNLRTSLKVANYCIRHRIPHRLIGHIKYYNAEEFFRALWKDGYFETVVNGKYAGNGAW